MALNSKIPAGPLETKWTKYKSTCKLVNPANKLVPGFGAAPTTLTGATLKAGGQGAVANVLTQPVEDQSKSFTTQKIEQALTGGVFGGGFGAGLHLLTTGLGRSVESLSEIVFIGVRDRCPGFCHQRGKTRRKCVGRRSCAGERTGPVIAGGCPEAACSMAFQLDPS